MTSPNAPWKISNRWVSSKREACRRLLSSGWPYGSTTAACHFIALIVGRACFIQAISFAYIHFCSCHSRGAVGLFVSGCVVGWTGAKVALAFLWAKRRAVCLRWLNKNSTAFGIRLEVWARHHVVHFSKDVLQPTARPSHLSGPTRWRWKRTAATPSRRSPKPSSPKGVAPWIGYRMGSITQ
jgi:hypothetical protein